MLYFLEKAGKIAAALEAPPPNPRSPSAVGGSAARPPGCYSHSIYMLFFEHCADFSTSLKLKLQLFSYLSDS